MQDNKENEYVEPQKQAPISNETLKPQPKVEENKNQELLVIGGGGFSKPNSLQKNFERFRKQKKEQIKYKKYVAENSGNVNRKDPEFN